MNLNLSRNAHGLLEHALLEHALLEHALLEHAFFIRNLSQGLVLKVPYL